MNIFFNKKRKFALAALFAVCLTSSLQAIDTADLKFVEQITQAIKSLIQSSEASVNAFKDKKNTTSLQVYITEVNEKMKFVHSAILAPLQQRMPSLIQMLTLPSTRH